MEWARILAYITGTVDQELLLRNEYLVAENRILKAQLKERLRLSDAERPLWQVCGRGRRSSWPLGPYRRIRLLATCCPWWRLQRPLPAIAIPLEFEVRNRLAAP
jgi:putative transposase